MNNYKGGTLSMETSVFISYSHHQKDWVHTRLVPCLDAGGAEVLIDERQMKAGRKVIAEMDSLQDRE